MGRIDDKRRGGKSWTKRWGQPNRFQLKLVQPANESTSQYWILDTLPISQIKLKNWFRASYKGQSCHLPGRLTCFVEYWQGLEKGRTHTECRALWFVVTSKSEVEVNWEFVICTSIQTKVNRQREFKEVITNMNFCPLYGSFSQTGQPFEGTDPCPPVFRVCTFIFSHLYWSREVGPQTLVKWWLCPALEHCGTLVGGEVNWVEEKTPKIPNTKCCLSLVWAVFCLQMGP